MRYHNFHCHTTFSDGLHTIEETVLAAIEQNMPSIGISDHSFTACDPSYCMRQEDYPQYLEELARVKARYADRITVYAGLELDAMSQVDTAALDYIIASVHYLVAGGVCYPVDESAQIQRKCVQEAFGGDWVEMARCYYDTLVPYVERVKPAFVAHFDIIDKFSLMPTQDPAYQRIALDALEKTVKSCPYLELNTGVIARGYRKTPYPAQFLLDAARELGARIVLSSDAHHKDGLTFWFDEAVALLKQTGFEAIHVLENGKFVPQALA